MPVARCWAWTNVALQGLNRGLGLLAYAKCQGISQGRQGPTGPPHMSTPWPSLSAYARWQARSPPIAPDLRLCSRTLSYGWWCRNARSGCSFLTSSPATVWGVGVPVMTHLRSALKAQANCWRLVMPRDAPSTWPSSSTTRSQCT